MAEGAGGINAAEQMGKKKPPQILAVASGGCFNV
jgi:hypothetical protein